ncbi:hypothetical protein TcasGA2_TC032039 [Tribolium castaneum]|uniref:Uncharacterized protein n=1 Tax=Tribolium castaneum TaxID=7070 RepID=A0A139WM13_TRICA|nr:hypothetical protein TcasGA2_TC032039 [Tribolium castaneum]
MKFLIFGSRHKYVMNESGQVPSGKFCALDAHPPVRLTRHRWYESHRIKASAVVPGEIFSCSKYIIALRHNKNVIVLTTAKMSTDTLKVPEENCCTNGDDNDEETEEEGEEEDR